MNLQIQEPETIDTSSPTRTSWRNGILSLVIFFCVYNAMFIGMLKWSGQKVRPLFIAGQMIWMATFLGLAFRRRQQREKDPTYRWYRFSLAELFVIATGFAVFAGFLGADLNQQRNFAQQHEHLQIVASEILGPDGHLGFESNGSLTIGICDRTFDDKRFIELSKLVHNYVKSNSVSRVLFGTGSNTAGTPPRWPGITDSTVDLLLEWSDITMLIVEGTEITTEGRKRLLSLKNLDKRSQKSLSRE